MADKKKYVSLGVSEVVGRLYDFVNDGDRLVREPLESVPGYSRIADRKGLVEYHTHVGTPFVRVPSEVLPSEVARAYSLLKDDNYGPEHANLTWKHDLDLGALESLLDKQDISLEMRGGPRRSILFADESGDSVLQLNAHGRRMVFTPREESGLYAPAPQALELAQSIQEYKPFR